MGHSELNRLTASDVASCNSLSALRCAPSGCTARSIRSKGKLAMPDARSLQTCVKLRWTCCWSGLSSGPSALKRAFCSSLSD